MQLKSVNSNFTLALRSGKFGQAKTHFLSHVGGKREKKMAKPGFEQQSVDQKLIMLTITPLVPCWKISKSIYLTYIVMRQKLSLSLSKFS